MVKDKIFSPRSVFVCDFLCVPKNKLLLNIGT